MASRDEPQQRRRIAALKLGAAQHQAALKIRDPLTATLCRASTVTSIDRTAAVIAAPADDWRQSSLKDLGIRNIFVEPRHQGTGHEVLLALLMLESRVDATTPILFLPTDHIVEDEEVMTDSLRTMVQWITDEPGPVYLLGAVPQGPHDQLGYILPWYDAMLVPAGVYEFVERPDIDRARKLINAGGLWNTFIFGGTITSLLELFRARFDATIDALRDALRSSRPDLVGAYERLTSVDLSQDVLAHQTDRLNVLRLLRCGWWPLKPPMAKSPPAHATASRLDTAGSSRERRRLG
jgi:mannose-1-phosphate guanylyltransferase